MQLPFIKAVTNQKNIFQLILASAIVGIMAALLGIGLKHITEHYEALLFRRATGNRFWIVVFPVTGLALIYILRHYLFKKKENKGIKEVFESNTSGKPLPSYKIPSHFINGLITVAFGGSTGIEVSTVVATAAVGSLASQKESFLKKYRRYLLCAGVAAGITALFNAPLAGILFTYEVIYKKFNRLFALSTVTAAAVAFGFTIVLDEAPVFNAAITQWHLRALPWFILLGILGGLQSVYLTKSVLFFKKQFLKFSNPYYKIITGGLVISCILLLLPQLYGEGYHAIKHSIMEANTTKLSVYFTVTILALLILKPIITSITLSAGGDGGVFAPGIFLGAFLGLFLAVVLNTFFNAGVIPLNFMIVGMAAVLSASIHAPLTALFLVCGLTNSYVLFIPLAVTSFIAMNTAKKIYPYTVYSYGAKK
ncbi:chloride channel protein [Flavobacterium akiainvivens]|uniref:Chloride channel protein n=1 Tax=Flavobacterium akiainvivens TaxID=1202724 RepID=A0A0M8M911_9FLAO|nr:chloride channel protein [Flavobacterium akiainvivens]KOS06033.1 chloride channel protein [Flavobacterium akiainvivens]SFQ54395.1 chloride channel protein, CIC family [Flavobacterium akiainvivens]